MRTVLSIQSQVAAARVGNSVAAFAMERLGVRVFAVPTTLLGRRPDRGPPGGAAISAEILASIFDAMEADGKFPQIDAVLSGYLASPEQADVIADVVARVKTANANAIYCCDPVMGDDGKLYVSEKLVDAFKTKLLPIADLIAPNAFELGVLANAEVCDLASARVAAARLGKTALVSSIPHGEAIAAALVADDKSLAFATPRLPFPARGAGDLFAALFLAHVLNEESDALIRAMGSTFDVIASGGEDLALPDHQDLLINPRTAPQTIEIGV